MTLDKIKAYWSADFVIIAPPTDNGPEANYFETSMLGCVGEEVVPISAEAVMVIKSIGLVGCAPQFCEDLDCNNIMF